MSMTMMNDDDDVKIVSDVLDDVQSKEKNKKKKRISTSRLLLCSNLQGLCYRVCM